MPPSLMFDKVANTTVSMALNISGSKTKALENCANFIGKHCD